MASFKNHPVYFSTMIALGLCAVGAGWFIYDSSSKADKNMAKLAQKQAEFEVLQRANPVPSEDNKLAVEADLIRTEEALLKMSKELKGRGPQSQAINDAVVPTEPTDLFFDIATFVEKMRASGSAQNIKIKPDEYFGFASYASAGPDRELIPQVFRQRQIAEYILTALIEAEPAELLSFQREHPLTDAERAAGKTQNSKSQAATGANKVGADDFFEIDPQITARVAGFVNASAFRVVFVGETASLRTLLNKLASFELPLVVRSVEVEPVVNKKTGNEPSTMKALTSIFGQAANPKTEPAAAKPLVEKVRSKFTVTVELIDLVETPKTEAP